MTPKDKNFSLEVLSSLDLISTTIYSKFYHEVVVYSTHPLNVCSLLSLTYT